MEINVGQVVFSKMGHDKGGAFIVLAIEEEYLLLADGKRRTLEKPKQKKRKHVQPTNFVNEQIAEKILSGAHLMNADVAKAIQEFCKSEGSK